MKKSLKKSSLGRLGRVYSVIFTPERLPRAPREPQEAPRGAEEAPGVDFGSHVASCSLIFDVFRVCFGLRFRCVFKLILAMQLFSKLVPLRRARPKGGTRIHRKNHMIFMIFQGALSRRRRQQGEENNENGSPKNLPTNVKHHYLFFSRRKRQWPKSSQK